MPELTVPRWEDPPPARGNGRAGRMPGSRYDREAVLMIANPGRWRLIHAGVSRNTANNLAVKIRRGWIGCFAPGGDFDGCARTVNGQHCVYVRYLGDGEDDRG